MNTAEKILERFARKNMVSWDQESFKRNHRRLHESIIEAINEALRIHDVVGRSEQFKCRNVSCDELVSRDSNDVFCEKHKRRLGI